MLTFGWGSCRAVFAEPNFGDLMRAHWEELAVFKTEMSLDPDFNRYLALDEAGLYRVWVARDTSVRGLGTLAGYIGWFIERHIHHKTVLTAFEDLYVLSPAYRQGTNGWRMFRSAIDDLRKMGVQRVIVHKKVHFQQERGGLDLFFKRLGFTHTDDVLSRML